MAGLTSICYLKLGVLGNIITDMHVTLSKVLEQCLLAAAAQNMKKIALNRDQPSATNDDP
ncbi:hypothetical protein GCM10010096_13730 [Alcaligenes pakistanensis]|uniref:Uncharacterized protein n=1 Tax=Alcaligenes pakistanensis TaxID=1482717 RepID=A0A8H9IGN2_9BURK|nr:hypothetical protein [Alcaligenes pakistanensis]MBP6620776.1 hypothetical protein [Alcaligenes sp.]GHC43827.1 hypothetical protein GCM10010096_13730 [Alcaligenes pakistanensis]